MSGLGFLKIGKQAFNKNGSCCSSRFYKQVKKISKIEAKLFSLIVL